MTYTWKRPGARTQVVISKRVELPSQPIVQEPSNQELVCEVPGRLVSCGWYILCLEASPEGPLQDAPQSWPPTKLTAYIPRASGQLDEVIARCEALPVWREEGYMTSEIASFRRR
jgi:hypothetical protein